MHQNKLQRREKYKFYQYGVWNKAPAYVVKVKAGNREDESRNNKQKNILGHVGLGELNWWEVE